MKALVVTLILLVQLPIHKAVPAAPVAPLGCDDPESEAAAQAAVNYINSHNHHGYKFALNRIENIRVLPQGPNNAIIFLEVDLLETHCHILSPTPLENCTVRSFREHAVEGDCDIKLEKSDGKLNVLATKCHSHADSSEDVVQLCPDCPLLTSLNNTEVTAAVAAALRAHNSKTTDAYLRLLEIGRARIQHGLAHIVFVEFAVAATNCSAEEAKVNEEACQLLPDDQSNFGFCTATMVIRPKENLIVDCQLYGHQVQTPDTPFLSRVLQPTSPVRSDHPEFTSFTVDCVNCDNLSLTLYTKNKPGVTYSPAGQDTSLGLVPSVAQGFTNHNLRLSHNNPVASESMSSEVSASTLSSKLVAKRAVAQHDKVPHPVGFVSPPLLCPGKVRHFKI